jgi:excisionase family DNA binding protein
MCSVEEVARCLGLNVRTVRTYLRTGRLKGVRIGKQYRIRRQDLDALVGRESSSARGPITRHRQIDVSTIVQINVIGPGPVSRVTNMLMAAAKGPRDDDQPLRVDTSYDEERARLKVFVSGSLATTISMLGLVNKLIEPEGV